VRTRERTRPRWEVYHSKVRYGVCCNHREPSFERFNNNDYLFGRLSVFGRRDWNRRVNEKRCLVNLKGVMSIALSQRGMGRLE
jgi:hypothetical protein